MGTHAIEQTQPLMETTPRIGVYVCRCGLNIAQTVDCEGIAAAATYLPDVSVAKEIGYACSGQCSGDAGTECQCQCRQLLRCLLKSIRE